MPRQVGDKNTKVRSDKGKKRLFRKRNLAIAGGIGVLGVGGLVALRSKKNTLANNTEEHIPNQEQKKEQLSSKRKRNTRRTALNAKRVEDTRNILGSRIGNNTKQELRELRRNRTPENKDRYNAARRTLSEEGRLAREIESSSRARRSRPPDNANTRANKQRVNAIRNEMLTPDMMLGIKSNIREQRKWRYARDREAYRDLVNELKSMGNDARKVIGVTKRKRKY